MKKLIAAFAALVLMLLGVMVSSPALADDTAPVEPTEVVTPVEETAPIEEAIELAPVGVEVASIAEIDPTPYVLIAWPMPLWVNSTTPTWPQGGDLGAPITLDLATKNLNALDTTLADPQYCSLQFQIDGNFDNQVSRSLIAGGFLNGPGNPPEALWGGGWGEAYKLLKTADCPVVTNSCEPGQGDTSTNLNDLWAEYDTRSAGHHEYIDGALHVWTDDGSGNAKVSEARGLTFDLKNSGTFVVNVTDNQPDAPAPYNHYGPGLNLFVDFDNDGSIDGTLVYETIYGQDLWVTNGSKQFVKDASLHTGGNGSDNHGTIDHFLTTFPDAVVKGVAYSLGSGALGDFNINSLVFNCATYTFDYIEPVKEPTPVTPLPPTFSDVCGTEDDSYTIPDDTDEYYYIESEGSVIVDVYPNEGFVFPEGMVTHWEFEFTDEACATATPEPTPTVTATPTPTPTETTPPVVTVDNPITPTTALATPTLASTGSDFLLGLLMVIVLVAIGVTIFLLARRKPDDSPQHARNPE